MIPPREPTPEECDYNGVVCQDGEQIGYATWYPQMGGYCGKAVAVCCKSWTETSHGSRTGGCIDVYVWHDGEFPFSEGDDGRSPAVIHHCDPQQFIEFGEKLKRLNDHGRSITAE